MTDEFKLIKARERASQAEALLRNELLQESLTYLEKRYMDEWRITHINDVVAREKLFLAVNIVGKVRDHLTTTISSGKIAQIELNRMTGLNTGLAG